MPGGQAHSKAPSASAPVAPGAVEEDPGSFKSALDHAGEWLKLVSAFGIPLYVFLWAAASAFYSRLGVDPQEVGLDYGSILIKSWGQLFFLGLGVAVYLFLLQDRLDPLRRAAIWLLVPRLILWWGVLLLLAVTHSSDVRKGSVRPSTLLFVPITPWSVWPTTAEAAGESPPAELTAITGDCLFYLGKEKELPFSMMPIAI
jgi:hypothetical protein